MKKIFLPVMMLVALASASCGSTASTAAAGGEGETAAAEAPETVEGKWRIDNVVVNDTLFAVPAQETPDEPSYITFDNQGNYFIQTNCNTMMGTYTLSGDTLTMGGGASTRMACPNMKVEDLLTQVLPLINSVEMQNDSVAKLGSGSAACVMLVRSEEVEAGE